MRIFILSCAFSLCTVWTSAQNIEPFALVELYTSQGCSSCPRADQYLSEVIKDSEQENTNVIALSFHVDYWNRLGWKDPYSSQANTQRQYHYARSLRSSSVYTPQMIVNGSDEFVGSNRQKGTASIQAGLKETPKMGISLRATIVDPQNVKVNYAIEGNTSDGEVLNLAIVEKGIITPIGRGENGGRTLSHDNVVRVFQTLSTLKKQGFLQMEIPEDLVKENASVVAFIQQEGPGKVVAAELIPLQ